MEARREVKGISTKYLMFQSRMFHEAGLIFIVLAV
jgi:hypothetical protein